MEMRILGIMAAAVLVAAWNAPSSTHPSRTNYTAQLNGAMEIPPNTSKATGTATFSLEGNELHYMVTVHGLSGPASAAHIHAGKSGESGKPVLKLEIKNVADGQLADDSVDLSKMMGMGVSGDSVKALLANGAAYVNVHTAKFPGGEVRGQLTAQ